MPFLEVYKEKCSQLCCDPITSVVEAADSEYVFAVEHHTCCHLSHSAAPCTPVTCRLHTSTKLVSWLLYVRWYQQQGPLEHAHILSAVIQHVC